MFFKSLVSNNFFYIFSLIFIKFTGVYRRSTNIKHFIDVNSVPELHKISSRRSKLTIGANVSLNEAMDILESVAADKSDFSYCRELAKHIDLVATVPIRNVSIRF